MREGHVMWPVKQASDYFKKLSNERDRVDNGELIPRRWDALIFLVDLVELSGWCKGVCEERDCVLQSWEGRLHSEQPDKYRDVGGNETGSQAADPLSDSCHHFSHHVTSRHDACMFTLFYKPIIQHPKKV